MSSWREFPEQGVAMRFSGCTVLKWDEHPAFHSGLRKQQGTDAVDFAVLSPDARVALFELKDYRGHRIEDRRKLSSGELAFAVAEKVRDTIAGMTWACRRGLTDDAALEKIVSGLYRRDNEKLLVILWLDQDNRARAPEALALTQEIARHLRPHIHAKVVVTSLHLRDRGLPAGRYHWLEARSLPRTKQ